MSAHSIMCSGEIMGTSAFISPVEVGAVARDRGVLRGIVFRSEEHTSELQSLMRISYAGFCLKKKKIATRILTHSLTLYTIIQLATQNTEIHIILLQLYTSLYL